VVVVDDASTDGTQQFLRDDQPGAIRLRVVLNQRLTPEWFNGHVSAYCDDRIATHGDAICRFDHLFSSDFDLIPVLNIPTMQMKPI
jgi:glycosyltransferase involved in cell wall biosynthesis